MAGPDRRWIEQDREREGRPDPQFNVRRLHLADAPVEFNLYGFEWERHPGSRRARAAPNSNQGAHAEWQVQQYFANGYQRHGPFRRNLPAI